MAIEQFVKDMNIISALADEPTQTATELKAKFDEGGNALKTYINNTLKPYLDGMEDQIPKTYGAVSTILEEDLVASRAVMSSSEGKIAASEVTAEELSYLSGVTSSVQTQLSSKQNKITYGTQTPSDGSEGDIYIQYGE